MDCVTSVLHAQPQLARPLLPERQRGVQDVLLCNAHLVVQKLSDHRHVAGLMKLTALFARSAAPARGARFEPLANA